MIIRILDKYGVYALEFTYDILLENIRLYCTVYKLLARWVILVRIDFVDLNNLTGAG